MSDCSKELKMRRLFKDYGCYSGIFIRYMGHIWQDMTSIERFDFEMLQSTTGRFTMSHFSQTGFESAVLNRE